MDVGDLLRMWFPVLVYSLLLAGLAACEPGVEVAPAEPPISVEEWKRTRVHPEELVGRVSHLTSALRSTESQMRVASTCALAAYVYGHLADQPALDSLRDRLASLPEAREALLEVLSEADGNRDLLYCGLLSLAYVFTPGADIEALTEATLRRSDDAQTRAVAFTVLREHGYGGSDVERLRRGLADPNMEIRQWTTREIAEMDDPPLALLERLAEMLRTDDAWVQQGVIPAVAAYGDAARPYVEDMKAALERLGAVHPVFKKSYSVSYIDPLERSDTEGENKGSGVGSLNK